MKERKRIHRMKDNIVFLLIAICFIAFDVYIILNYNKILKRQLKAFGADEQNSELKKILNIKLKVGFLITIIGAIFSLLIGFHVL